MLNQATAKNDKPVITPENGGASWTSAVCTPGVCNPENNVPKLSRYWTKFFYSLTVFS